MNPAQGCLIGEPKTCDKHVEATIEIPSDAGSIPATSIRTLCFRTYAFPLKVPLPPDKGDIGRLADLGG